MPRTLLIATAAVLLVCGYARAQQTTEMEEEVVVTATRVPKALSETSRSVSVVTDREIWDRQVSEAAEAIRVVPGVFVSKGGPTGAPTSVYLRGAASNQTVVLVDGVKVNDPTLGGQFNFYDLGIENTQAIEVMRGSSSTLYGSEAIGGVVNVVTRSGERDLGGRGVLEGGMFGYYQFAAGGWYGTDAVEFSLETGAKRWENDLPNNEFEQQTLAGRVGTSTPDGLQLNLAGRLWSSKAEDPYEFPLGDQIEEDDNIRRERRTWLARLELLQEASEGIGWSLYATHFDVKSELRNGPDTRGARSELESDADATRQNYGATVTITDADPTESSNATLLVGAEYQVEDSENDTRSWDTTNGVWITSSVEGTVRNRAAYGHLDLGFGEYLVVGGGYRYDKNDIFGRASTWSGTAMLKIGEIGTRIRANYGQGIRAPTPIEFADPYVGNPDLEEERSTSFDIGWEQELFERMFAFTVTWFRLDTRDLIAYDAGAGRLENFGSTRTQGFELHATARLFDGLALVGYFTFQDPKNRDAGPGQEDRLPGRPEWFGGGTVEYRIGRSVTGLDLHASGDYPSTGKIDPDGNLRDRPGRKLLLTLRSSFDVGEGGRVILRIENLLDEEYYDQEAGPMGLGVGVYGGIAWEF